MHKNFTEMIMICLEKGLVSFVPAFNQILHHLIIKMLQFPKEHFRNVLYSIFQYLPVYKKLSVFCHQNYYCPYRRMKSEEGLIAHVANSWQKHSWQHNFL